MKKLFFILFTIITVTGFAQTRYTVTASTVNYEIKNLGIKTRGTFGSLQHADINFDPQHIDSSSIQAVVDVNQFNSGNSLRDEHVKGADFFDADNYPVITIKSVSLRSRSGNKFTGLFNLTIKNTTRKIEIPFTCTTTGNTSVFQAVFKINRMDYGVGGSTLTLSNDVSITVNIQATH